MYLVVRAGRVRLARRHPRPLWERLVRRAVGGSQRGEAFKFVSLNHVRGVRPVVAPLDKHVSGRMGSANCPRSSQGYRGDPLGMVSGELHDGRKLGLSPERRSQGLFP